VIRSRPDAQLHRAAVGDVPKVEQLRVLDAVYDAARGKPFGKWDRVRAVLTLLARNCDRHHPCQRALMVSR
jgi:hypothetical protein